MDPELYKQQGFFFPIRILTSTQSDEFAANYLSFQKKYVYGNKNERIKTLHRVLTRTSQIVRNPTLLNAVEALLGPNLLMWDLTFFSKSPNGRDHVSWHQDGHYWGIKSDNLLTAWIALTDSMIQNGCMKMIPGSHRWPPSPHREVEDNSNMLSRGQTLKTDIHEDTSVNIELKSGECSLHHLNIAHSSPPNTTKNVRLGLAVRYAANAIVTTNHATHDAVLVRGATTNPNIQAKPFSSWIAEREPWRSMLLRG